MCHCDLSNFRAARAICPICGGPGWELLPDDEWTLLDEFEQETLLARGGAPVEDDAVPGDDGGDPDEWLPAPARRSLTEVA